MSTSGSIPDFSDILIVSVLIKFQNYSEKEIKNQMKKQLTEIEKKEYSYLISVLSSAVNETPAPIPYENINWQRLLKRAKICGLDAAFSNTVLTLPKDYFTNDDVVKILKENINAEILIDSNHSYEIEKVLSAFDKYKIKNVPLKGYFIKIFSWLIRVWLYF